MTHVNAIRGKPSFFIPEDNSICNCRKDDDTVTTVVLDSLMESEYTKEWRLIFRVIIFPGEAKFLDICKVLSTFTDSVYGVVEPGWKVSHARITPKNKIPETILKEAESFAAGFTGCLDLYYEGCR